MIPDRRAGEIGAPLSFLPRTLLETRRPLQAILVGWATAFLPAIVLALVVHAVVPPSAQPRMPIDGLRGLFLVVVFAPVVETLLMAAALGLLLLFVRPSLAVLASAIGWAGVHSLIAPAWGLVIWWPFLVFSILFVTWRRRSLLAALAIPAAVHALNNLLPSLLILGGVAP